MKAFSPIKQSFQVYPHFPLADSTPLQILRTIVFVKESLQGPSFYWSNLLSKVRSMPLYEQWTPWTTQLRETWRWRVVDFWNTHQRSICSSYNLKYPVESNRTCAIFFTWLPTSSSQKYWVDNFSKVRTCQDTLSCIQLFQTFCRSVRFLLKSWIRLPGCWHLSPWAIGLLLAGRVLTPWALIASYRYAKLWIKASIVVFKGFLAHESWIWNKDLRIM